MSVSSGVQGCLLEVTVVGCSKLKNTEWVSRQDPYVCIEYGSTKYRTTTCTDGGKNPTFQEKFVFSLIEGLKELKVLVWNSNTLTYDDLIGSGKVLLHKVLSQGYDDSAWPLETKTGRNAGEVRLIMHHDIAKISILQKNSTSFAPSAPPYIAPTPQVYSSPAQGAATPYAAPYPPPSSAYPHFPPNPSYTSAYTPSPSPYPPGPYPGNYPPPY